MQNKMDSAAKIWRSALALKTYFEKQLGATLELLAEAPTLGRTGDIPLGPDLRAQGIWGLRPQSPLDASDVDAIAATFSEVLHGKRANAAAAAESELAVAAAAGKMAAVEPTLAGGTVESGTPSNVIRLRPRRADKRWDIRHDLMIECAASEDIYKLALELHSHTRRYAFLNFHDLEVQSRTHIPDLLVMGSITLFVPDVTLLNIEEQECLRKLIAIRSVDRPLLMVGTPRPIAEILRAPGTHPQFVENVSKVYLNLTRPFREYKEQGLIEYFLDSLSQHPS